MTAVPHAAQTFSADEKRITIIGVMLVFLLSALDQTIVSTAMPRIVAQLNGISLYAWVTTAYMLCSTVMVPIYGKLGDIYGRKSVLIVGILLFMVGSAFCGLAGEFGSLPVLGGGMTQLIVFRGVQGLGGGALFTSAFAIIADLFPPRERAKFGGLFGAVFGLASILGPVIGGFFTDLGMTHVLGYGVAGWRWVFYVNLPISALSLFMIISKMPALTHRNPGKIDFVGAILIAVTFIPLLLALSWGGRNYGWGSPQIVGLLAVSVAGLAGFVWTESVVANPILSLSLFKNRVFSTANAANFVTSMAFMGSVAFLPLYMQLGQGVKATTSGLSMLPMMAGLIASSAISGQLITRLGKYKPFLVIGGAILIGALYLISKVGPETTSFDLAWRMVILGLGLGPSMGTYNVAIQNAVGRSQIGVATSSSQFFRQIGGTVGIALFGAVLTHNLASVASKLPAPPGGAPRAMDMGKLQQMAMGGGGEGAAAVPIPPQALLMIRTLIVDAITGVFAVAVGVAAVALLLALLIPALPLENRESSGPPMPEV